MTPERFAEITARYAALRIAVVGDFCLDRYLEIDPARAEVSIETGLPVHNVIKVRSQPGAAGTILANLAALGIGELHAVGFAGDDGEGFELRRALAQLPRVKTDRFARSRQVQTFTYTKPLIAQPGETPRELSRLDRKNWASTPARLANSIARFVRELASVVDAIVVMDQVPVAGTGVITEPLRGALADIATARPDLPIFADSRRSLGDFPPVIWKMNAAELAVLAGTMDEEIAVKDLAERNGRAVFATLAERGILAAQPDGTVERVPAFPVQGPIDIVGAGDAVTANLSAACAAGATLREAMELAMAAASIVIHQVGTTGIASLPQLREMLAAATLPPSRR